ncbi:hypothetical protein C492_22537 [Natronococcus jeotgali DSM 18795]|uniref:Uncharacterized protein n=1 Tax=Natronococcus jeotgali DSM 18795 TaxID=1227498 RepID=L9WN17_9EURY|nr:hypothetical protein C492_22537 [Natronococcus jeotgali DSM 18795]
MQANQSMLIDAPPASGKTTKTFEVIDEADDTFTYLTKREDLYEQAENLGEESDLSLTIIPSPHRSCPSFDSTSPHYHPEAPELHGLGVRAGQLHDLLDLTCTPDCPYQKFWEDFEAAEHDVLVGHYKHAYISSVIEDRVVIIDEFPGDAFEQPFKDAPKMLSRFLKVTDDIPFDDWDDLIIADEDEKEQAYEWFAANGIEEDAEIIIEADKTTRYHAIAPFLTWTVLESLKGDNGFGFPWFNLEASETISTSFGELENNRRVAIDHEERRIHVLTQPNLDDAKRVIGLDGTPLPEQWGLVTGEDFDHETLIEQDTAMNSYIRDILGVSVKQANDHLKAYHGGHITANRDEAILYGVEVKEGQKPALIAPKKAIDAYRDVGILDRTNHWMNYANVLSSNDFKDEPVGVIHGAPHPGDATLKKWAAYFGHHIEGRGEGMEKTYGDFGDRLYHHFVHNQVLQAILRFGRGESEATVYVNTAAIPDWLDIDGKVNPKLFNRSNKRAIADYLREVGDQGASKSDLADEVDVTEKTIKNRLNEFDEEGLIEEVQESDWPYRKIYRWSP